MACSASPAPPPTAGSRTGPRWAWGPRSTTRSWMSWADAPCWTGPAPRSTPSRSAPREGEKTEPNPTDRGKPGSKLHLLCDDQGLPLTCAVSEANVNDIETPQPLVRGILAVRSRRGPRRRPTKLHGDKAYHSRNQRRWLRERGIGVLLARPGFEASQRLGRHRYKVERSIAWLSSAPTAG